MLYTIDEIAERIRPVAKRYGLRAVYLFGSYASGTATADSDVDLLVDTEGTEIRSLLQLSALYCELEEALGKPVDLVPLRSLEQPSRLASERHFREAILQERVSLYAA